MSRDWRGVVDRLKAWDGPLRLADRLGRDGRRPTGGPVDLPLPRRPDVNAFARADLAALWVGHATLLLRVGGRTVLTDPVWSHRVGLGLGPLTLGPRRLVAPALPLRRLPRVDVLAVTHAHFDHLDLPTLRALRRTQPHAGVVAAAGLSDLLESAGWRGVTELPPGQEADVAGVRVTAYPVRHWTPRVIRDTWRSAVAFSFRAGGQHVVFGGDTAYFGGFDGLRPDVLAVGIGAYDPYVASHATPEQAWSMFEASGARRVLPFHHATFRLSREVDAEPVKRFLAAARRAGRVADVAVRRPGDVWREESVVSPQPCVRG